MFYIETAGFLMIDRDDDMLLTLIYLCEKITATGTVKSTDECKKQYVSRIYIQQRYAHARVIITMMGPYKRNKGDWVVDIKPNSTPTPSRSREKASSKITMM